MPRPVDELNRSQLIDRVLDDVLKHGIGSLALRRLAKRIGVSPALLIYHFTSKDDLTMVVLRRAGDRQRALFETLRSQGAMKPHEVCRDIWNAATTPETIPLFRLFFEMYGLALQDRARFPDFFPGAIELWLDFIGVGFERSGATKNDARIEATILLASFRGFLLDLCATEDYDRVNGAVEIWLRSLRSWSVPATKPGRKAR